jgi:hypothetical protein
VKFVFYNDTGKPVSIHPSTVASGCKCDESDIQPLQERIFELPDGTFPWVKMWDYGFAMQIFVAPKRDVKLGVKD